MHLFYVSRDGRTLTKCVGDIKSASFGKKLTSIEYDFWSGNRKTKPSSLIEDSEEEEKQDQA